MTLEQTEWAAIGLLALFVVGMVPVFLIELRAMGGRIDRMDAKMDRRFDGVDRQFERVDHKFEQVDQRLERLENKIDAVDAKLIDHVGRHAG